MTSIEIVGADGENKPENKSATKSTVASDAYRKLRTLMRAYPVDADTRYI